MQYLSIKEVKPKILNQIVDLHSKYSIESRNENVLHCFKYQKTMINIYTNHTIYISAEDIELWIRWINKYNSKLANYLLNEYHKNQLTKNNKANHKIDQEQLYKRFDILIGSDEVGVGDFFGGIVVCAVALSVNDIAKYKDFKIDDSKQISDEYIINHYDSLLKKSNYVIKHYSPIEYNQQIAIYKNMHIIKTILHIEAINELKAKIQPANIGLVLDAYCTQTNFNKYAQAANLKPILFDVLIPKAESHYLCVGIASMIARGFFLKAMNNISNKLKINLPFGAWNEKIKATAQLIIQQKGFNVLEKIAKNHFKPFQDLKKENDSNS